MNKLILIFLLSFLSSKSFAQTEAPAKKDEKIVKFLFTFDSRNAFAYGISSKMFGFRIGIEIIEKHRIGNGFYSMNEPVILYNIDAQDNKETINFGYSSLFYEYVLYTHKRWEVAPTFYTGGGSAKITKYQSDGSQILDENGNNLSVEKNVPVSMIGIGINSHYKPIRFAGIGFGIGYRQILTNKNDIRIALNSPIYVIKIKLFLGEFLKKNPNKKS